MLYYICYHRSHFGSSSRAASGAVASVMSTPEERAKIALEHAWAVAKGDSGRSQKWIPADPTDFMVPSDSESDEGTSDTKAKGKDKDTVTKSESETADDMWKMVGDADAQWKERAEALERAGVPAKRTKLSKTETSGTGSSGTGSSGHSRK